MFEQRNYFTHTATRFKNAQLEAIWVWLYTYIMWSPFGFGVAAVVGVGGWLLLGEVFVGVVLLLAFALSALLLYDISKN